MLDMEVMMPFDLVMGIVGVQQHHYDPLEWVKMQSEVIPQKYDLVKKNLSGTLKCRRYYDLKLVEDGYEVGDYVHKIDFTTKTWTEGLFPVLKGPFYVAESSHPFYKTEACKFRQTTIHHDQLKICRDKSKFPYGYIGVDMTCLI